MSQMQTNFTAADMPGAVQAKVETPKKAAPKKVAAPKPEPVVEVAPVAEEVVVEETTTPTTAE